MDRQLFLKAANFCVYQERTQDEVRKRLNEWGLYGDAAEEVICELIQENFINEERFARIFAGSKFRVKKWGRLKIRHELKQRKLSDFCIKAGLSEIDDDDYYETLKLLLEKKMDELRKETDPRTRKAKVVRFSVGKGFENNLVWEIMNDLERIEKG